MTSAKKQTIHETIIAVMRDIGAIGKNQRNIAQNFNFRGIDDVYNSLQKTMATHGLFSTVSILEETRKEVKNSGGRTGVHTIIKYEYTFYNEHGDNTTTQAIGEGIDYGDKASNKCASIAHKYALIQLFCIPTEDLNDPDKESHESSAKFVKKDPPTDDYKMLCNEYVGIRTVMESLSEDRQAEIYGAALKRNDPTRLAAEIERLKKLQAK